MTEREIIYGLLKVVEVRSARGTPLQMCTGCVGSKEHNRRSRLACDCMCHKARLWLEATAEDTDEPAGPNGLDSEDPPQDH